MSSQFARLASIRDYWMTRDLGARVEVKVTDLDAVLNELVRASSLAANRHTANIKLIGALDMIREALNGGNVEDLLLTINDALRAAAALGDRDD
jgi:hypothetical protein